MLGGPRVEVPKILVGGYEDVERFSGASEEFAVLEPGPPVFWNRADLRAVEVPSKSARQRLVK
jgi:hypothetical protein